jgi:hypothetical protein
VYKSHGACNGPLTDDAVMTSDISINCTDEERQKSRIVLKDHGRKRISVVGKIEKVILVEGWPRAVCPQAVRREKAAKWTPPSNRPNYLGTRYLS